MSGPLAVDPAEIVEQRKKGWTEFHPEAFCHRCGQRNICWWTMRELWDAAQGDSFGGGVLCPQCFVELYEAHVGRKLIWEIRLNGIVGEFDTKNMHDLLVRVADLERQLSSTKENPTG